MWTPLFVKLSGQKTGKMDDRPVLSVDVLPTIADALDVDIPWKIDGRSALGAPRREGQRPLYQFALSLFSPSRTLRAPKGGHRLSFDGRSGFAEVLAARVALPGGDPTLRINRIGPYEALIGRAVDSVPATGTTDITASIPDGQLLNIVDPHSHLAPWIFSGGLLTNLGADRDLAIALNGRIVALTEARPIDDAHNGGFAFVAPPSAFVRGRNDVRVFLVTGTPSSPVLANISVTIGPQ